MPASRLVLALLVLAEIELIYRSAALVSPPVTSWHKSHEFCPCLSERPRLSLSRSSIPAPQELDSSLRRPLLAAVPPLRPTKFPWLNGQFSLSSAPWSIGSGQAVSYLSRQAEQLATCACSHLSLYRSSKSRAELTRSTCNSDKAVPDG